MLEDDKEQSSVSGKKQVQEEEETAEPKNEDIQTHKTRSKRRRKRRNRPPNLDLRDSKAFHESQVELIDTKSSVRDSVDSKTTVNESEEDPGPSSGVDTQKYNEESAIEMTNDPIAHHYSLDHGKIGHVVIINQDIFTDTKYPKREGSEKDVERTQRVFSQLGFSVAEPLHNLTLSQIKKKISDLKDNKDLLRQSSCLVIVYMSHGEKNDEVMATDQSFHLYDIVSRFTPDDFPELVGKPKLFILQACRGEEIDSGTLVKSAKMMMAPATFDLTDGTVEQALYKYPNFADILIAFSSHHGHYSFRNENGSWFIQEFCNAVEKCRLDEDHILDILTTTNSQVAQRSSLSEEAKFDDKKQISSFYSTLTKKFYFKKKPESASR